MRSSIKHDIALNNTFYTFRFRLQIKLEGEMLIAVTYWP